MLLFYFEKNGVEGRRAGSVGCRKGYSEHQKKDIGKGVKNVGEVSTWKGSSK